MYTAVVGGERVGGAWNKRVTEDNIKVVNEKSHTSSLRVDTTGAHRARVMAIHTDEVTVHDAIMQGVFEHYIIHTSLFTVTW